jgi:hypothetical protein
MELRGEEPGDELRGEDHGNHVEGGEAQEQQHRGERRPVAHAERRVDVLARRGKGAGEQERSESGFHRGNLLIALGTCRSPHTAKERPSEALLDEIEGEPSGGRGPTTPLLAPEGRRTSGIPKAALWSPCRLSPMMRQGPGITLKRLSAIGLGAVQPERSEASVEGPSTPGLRPYARGDRDPKSRTRVRKNSGARLSVARRPFSAAARRGRRRGRRLHRRSRTRSARRARRVASPRRSGAEGRRRDSAGCPRRRPSP